MRLSITIITRNPWQYNALRSFVQTPQQTSAHPHRLPKSSIPWQNRSHAFRVVCNGSPSRILSVRLISLGMTTRPSSSILRTIPVARNVSSLLDGGATLMPHCFAVCLCIPSMEFGGAIMLRKDMEHGERWGRLTFSASVLYNINNGNGKTRQGRAAHTM